MYHERSKNGNERNVIPLLALWGVFTPGNWLFNCNLQEFAQRVSIVEALHTAGKISTSQAIEQLKFLWEGLEKGYYSLEINKEEDS